MSQVNTNYTYNASLEYAQRGWAVIAVHGLSDPERGRCTCGKYPCDTDNGRAGKHPVHGGWTSGPAMSPADIYATWEEDGPDWNVGIRTGEPSGFFALDIDPKSGGMEQLQRLELENAPLPATRTVRTGSGGRHYYFAMPDFPVRNNVHRLAPGIDVRGTGGMVVAPPSVSGVGAYELIVDMEPQPAPAWLLDLLSAPSGFTPSAGVSAEDLPEWGDLPPDEQVRVQRYATVALEREALTYEIAPPGCGNATLFASACSMLTIVQSPWNTSTSHDVVRMLDQARQRRNLIRRDGGQDTAEFRQAFQSAQKKVVGQGRPFPPDRTEGLLFDHPLSGSVATDDDAADPADGLLFDVEIPAVVKPRGTQLERLRSRLHTRSELEQIMPPTPLIEGVLDVGTMNVLAGQFGSFKTFATIGWACAVATGVPWLGHEITTPGPVLYIAAEGASGIKLRVRAWERDAGVTVADDRLYVLDVPVNLGDEEQCVAVLTIARAVGAVLVIFDTLHRCTPGLDENDSGDMGRITAVADALREGAGAATLYVHHTGHAGTRSRGASSIEDDADCVWVAGLVGGESRAPDRPRRLEQRKTKDSPLLDPFFVRLDLIDDTDSGVLELVTEDGVVISSGVAGRDPFMNAERPEVDLVALREQAEIETNDARSLVLNVFANTFHEHASGVTMARVQAVCKEAYGGLPKWSRTHWRRTFERAWGRLQVEGIIVENGGGRWLVVPAEDRVG